MCVCVCGNKATFAFSTTIIRMIFFAQFSQQNNGFVVVATSSRAVLCIYTIVFQCNIPVFHLFWPRLLHLISEIFPLEEMRRCCLFCVPLNKISCVCVRPLAFTKFFSSAPSPRKRGERRAPEIGRYVCGKKEEEASFWTCITSVMRGRYNNEPTI